MTGILFVAGHARNGMNGREATTKRRVANVSAWKWASPKWMTTKFVPQIATTRTARSRCESGIRSSVEAPLTGQCYQQRHLRKVQRHWHEGLRRSSMHASTRCWGAPFRPLVWPSKKFHRSARTTGAALPVQHLRYQSPDLVQALVVAARLHLHKCTGSPAVSTCSPPNLEPLHQQL